jgi:hypothetical protein
MKGDEMMIISRSNQPYGVAGSARQYSDDARLAADKKAVEPSVAGAGTAARQQWEDDGGPLEVHPPFHALKLSATPSWSIRSLRDLNLAIRLGHWPDNPSPMRRAMAEAESGRTAAEAGATVFGVHKEIR